MILHCVFLRVKAALTAAEKQALYEAVAALKEKIPGIVAVNAGPNVSPEGLNGGFLDGFTMTLESAEARDAYLSHPAHVDVSERLVAATDGGLAGILVFDMEI